MPKMSSLNPSTEPTPVSDLSEVKVARAQEALARLVRESKTAILATANDQGEPTASYAPFVTDGEGHFYIYVSALAKHTAYLRRGQPISLLLIEDESKTRNFFARARLTWTCAIAPIDREDPFFTDRMKAFRERFGVLIDTLETMRDFELFRIRPLNGRLVLGFGSAYAVDGHTIRYHLAGGHIRKG